MKEITPLGVVTICAIVVLGGLLPATIFFNKQQETIKQLENRPARIVVVTATPAATPSATLTPTKVINKIYFKPSVTLPVTIAPTK